MHQTDRKCPIVSGRGSFGQSQTACKSDKDPSSGITRPFVRIPGLWEGVVSAAIHVMGALQFLEAGPADCPLIVKYWFSLPSFSGCSLTAGLFARYA